jgi:Eco57I restriction-modification methylase/TaqI-like C-terminal specificity domain
VVDPACGSGVFLVTAFDYLKAEYAHVDKKIAQLRGVEAQQDFEDVDREILSQNLYGVDVNAESVEITKLSLWLKTAKKGKELDSLDHNIRVGDSLIEDSNFAYLKHGFSWNAAFPEVFAAGGFDVVLGNPPYVRQELLKDMKPYLKKRFEVYHGVADLYCYFFERGLRLLKHGGRLGYISSSTFFKTSSGAALRAYLKKEAALDSVTDFGDLQIFEGVTTYPAILAMRRAAAITASKFKFWKMKAVPEGNFGKAFVDAAQDYPQDKLGEDSWELESDALRQLRDKIVHGKKTLKEVYGSPYRGVLTGLNEAFVIDRATRDKLIADDPKSEELLKPWLEGKDLKRWRAEPRDIYVIFARRGVDIEKYPAVFTYLEQFRERLEPKPKQWQPTEQMKEWRGRKPGSYKWYELQDSIDYFKEFEKPKIIYNRFLSEPRFYLDTSGGLINDAPYFIPCNDYRLAALLNSNVFWYTIASRATTLSGGYFQLHAQYVETFIIPEFTEPFSGKLANCAMNCQSIAAERIVNETDFSRRIPDLCPLEREAKLSTKLQDWSMLDDFAAFRAEVKKCFKADIPLKERSGWEDMFASGKALIEKLSAEIKKNEDEINAIVYRLFELTADEIVLLETSIGAR